MCMPMGHVTYFSRDRNDTLKLTMTASVERYTGFMNSAWLNVAYSREPPEEDFAGQDWWPHTGKQRVDS